MVVDHTHRHQAWVFVAPCLLVYEKRLSRQQLSRGTGTVLEESLTRFIQHTYMYRFTLTDLRNRARCSVSCRHSTRSSIPPIPLGGCFSVFSCFFVFSVALLVPGTLVVLPEPGASSRQLQCTEVRTHAPRWTSSCWTDLVLLLLLLLFCFVSTFVGNGNNTGDCRVWR